MRAHISGHAVDWASSGVGMWSHGTKHAHHSSCSFCFKDSAASLTAPGICTPLLAPPPLDKGCKHHCHQVSDQSRAYQPASTMVGVIAAINANYPRHLHILQSLIFRSHLSSAVPILLNNP